MQVHTNIVVFNLRESAPLAAKDFILMLQQRDVHVIPFRCAAAGVLLVAHRVTLGRLSCKNAG